MITSMCSILTFNMHIVEYYAQKMSEKSKRINIFKRKCRVAAFG